MSSNTFFPAFTVTGSRKQEKEQASTPQFSVRAALYNHKKTMSGARALRNCDWEWAVEDQQATKMSFASPYFQAPVEDELCSILEVRKPMKT